ncbi:MAG: 2,4-dihydroxyhept-2-ene-1,7-dioic acid aldolase [Desulfobacterales bacterium]|nr:2,4-dihydroxyhept-2-ene-1,7-dioic acid aldolase [Desulfobacterales bacterium]
MNSNFRTRLINGDVLIGTLITIPSGEISEIISALGFDWLFVETEHTALNTQGAQLILQAAGDRCPCVVRIPANEQVWIKKSLDIGAAGIIAPQVNSAQEAEGIVRMCKYPPQGCRGVGVGRAHKYGLGFMEYMEKANDEVAVILQAENANAVKNISEIVQVPGVDAVLIGPYDLSASLGKMGQLADAEVQDAMAAIVASCKNAGVRLGIYADTAESALTYIKQGFTLIAVSSDGLHMAQSAKLVLTALKGALDI